MFSLAAMVSSVDSWVPYATPVIRGTSLPLRHRSYQEVGGGWPQANGKETQRKKKTQQGREEMQALPVCVRERERIESFCERAQRRRMGSHVREHTHRTRCTHYQKGDTIKSARTHYLTVQLTHTTTSAISGECCAWVHRRAQTETCSCTCVVRQCNVVRVGVGSMSESSLPQAPSWETCLRLPLRTAWL